MWGIITRESQFSQAWQLYSLRGRGTLVVKERIDAFRLSSDCLTTHVLHTQNVKSKSFYQGSKHPKYHVTEFKNIPNKNQKEK